MQYYQKNTVPANMVDSCLWDVGCYEMVPMVSSKSIATARFAVVTSSVSVGCGVCTYIESLCSLFCPVKQQLMWVCRCGCILEYCKVQMQ